MYAPLDPDEQNTVTNYHRSLYVFVCPVATCNGKPGSMRVLRCNLSKKNDFYAATAPPKVTGKEPINIAALEDAPYVAPSTPSTATPAAASTTPAVAATARVCLVCGLPGSKQCGGGCASSSMGPQYYCGAAHQRAHWRSGHKDECKGAASSTSTPAVPSTTETKSSSNSSESSTNPLDLATGVLSAAKIGAMKSEIWPEQFVDIEEEDWDSDGENEIERKMIEAYRKEEAAMSKQEKDAEGKRTTNDRLRSCYDGATV